MPYMTEEPVVHGNKEDTLGQYETHPAYGQISVGRVQGHAFLYGSEFPHQHYVTVKISRSQLNRSLSRDWHFGKDEIIEVALTEAQWATFVSSFNQGAGVPCTIERMQGVGLVPRIPQPKRTEKFKAEFAEDLGEIEKTLRDTLAKLEAGSTGLSKKKADELLGPVRRALQTVNSSIPFLNEQFEEHMEETIEKSKVEVEGYLNARVLRLGQVALIEQRGGTPLYALERDPVD